MIGIACCTHLLSPEPGLGRISTWWDGPVPFKQGSDVEETHVNERLGTKPKPNEKAPKKSKKENLGISISL
jgi:hypothetical protein